MSEIPEDLKYARSHEWMRIDGDTATVGITEHAQDLLGDLVFIELPEVGTTLEAGTECAVVESVKAASDVFSPMSGEVTEINEDLIDAPEVVNSSPYEAGWLFKMTLSNMAEANDLFDAQTYSGIADEDNH